MSKMFSTLQLRAKKIGWIVVERSARNAGAFPLEGALAWTKKDAIKQYEEVMGMSWAELQRLSNGKYDCIRVQIESAP